MFRDAELGVVGGGDSAVEEAVYLTKYSPKVSASSSSNSFRDRTSDISQGWRCCKSGTCGNLSLLVFLFKVGRYVALFSCSHLELQSVARLVLLCIPVG